MSDAALETGRKHPVLATLAHALGNVLLGVALGLGAYYGITDLAGRLRQDAMRDQLADLGPIAAEDPGAYVAEVATETLDFSGWEDEDKAYWDALEDGGAFGRLVIGQMELDAVVVKGHSRANLKKGPGWVDYTDYPGPTGNCGISGHRTTYGAPFRRLDSVAEGDTIDLYSPYRRYRYRVDDVFQVRPDQTEVMFSTPEPSLTLTACHPPYSARFRLVVRASLVEVLRFEKPQAVSE